MAAQVLVGQTKIYTDHCFDSRQ